MYDATFFALPTLPQVLATHEVTQFPYSEAYEIKTSDPTETLVIWESPATGQIDGHLATIGGTINLNPFELKELLEETEIRKVLIAA